jgi:hypothetical protein
VELALFFAIALLAVAFQGFGDARCRRYLQAWAAENGYVLDRITRRWLTLRFFLRSREQRVYEIEGHDANGNAFVADAKVGGYFLGSLSDRVEVRQRY